jgi:hypothetical protein
MQKLGISIDDVLTTINEWESGEVDATDPNTAQTLAVSTETEEKIPAFYDYERDFPERNQIINVKYSTSFKQWRGKTSIIAAVHWVCVRPSLLAQFSEDTQPDIDWLEPKRYN